jgi:membrane fusion protein (multidrug efflux system)
MKRDMADTVLKFENSKAEAVSRTSNLKGFLRRRLRTILLVVVPSIAALIGFGLYFTGGRYISTDNSYIGAQKVLITPDVSGRVIRVVVTEGQRVAAGDVLFEIDPAPFRFALTQAQSKLDSVRVDFSKLKSNLQTLGTLVDLAQKNVEIKQRDVDRKTTLAKSQAGSAADLDNAIAAVVAAQLQAEFAVQQRSDVLNQLLGKPDLPIEQFPPYMQASAVLDQAKRDLDHTVLKASISGTATQVDNIQLGRFVTAGSPVLSVIDDRKPWVDANPKETDVTYLRTGQKVEITVDAFPDRVFHGTVSSVSPGTGAQFAILPPQNASGNWVKVVQRLPVRIFFDAGEDISNLRAGMSVNVEIDTGRQRTLGTLLGLSDVEQAPARIAGIVP